jgi:hypothetical protein
MAEGKKMSENETNATATTSSEGTGAATYCPEDNKLRLYVGRVPRDEYLKLRAAGWVALHKQRETGGGDFAATWKPSREDTALEYSGGVIDDEDKSPQERAADRAERFGWYADKRANEAHGRADAFDAGPMVHGYQNAALAERRAARHDLQAGRAVNLWNKAEYWQSRTAGVITHALHKSAPGVRMGRIKEIEAELRGEEKAQAEAVRRWAAWEKVLTLPDLPESSEAWDMAHNIANASNEGPYYQHPEPDQVTEYARAHGSSLWDLLTNSTGRRITGHEAARIYLGRWKHPDDPGNNLNRWINHHRLRLAYEHQMLEAQGGRAAFVEMEPGGWIGKHQIQKVNKSNASGRVVSVVVIINDFGRWGENAERKPRAAVLKVERLAAEVYRAPTDDERAKFAQDKKAAAVERKATTPKAPSLINPTLQDAERLQAIWCAEYLAKHNASDSRHYSTFKPATVCQIKQEVYSKAAAGTYGTTETRELCAGGLLKRRNTGIYSASGDAHDKKCGAVLCKIRVTGYEETRRVIVITDKPQKPLPLDVWPSDEPARVTNARGEWEAKHAENVKRAQEYEAGAQMQLAV